MKNMMLILLLMLLTTTANSATNMKCENTTAYFARCENDEVICYKFNGTISCKFKEKKVKSGLIYIHNEEVNKKLRKLKGKKHRSGDMCVRFPTLSICKDRK